MEACSLRGSIDSVKAVALLAAALVGPITAQVTERVSVDSGGIEGNGWSGFTSISADGRYVVFTSYSSNFVPGDTEGFKDVFVRDHQRGKTECVSLDPQGAPGDEDSLVASISADGRYVAFGSLASNLVSGDRNEFVDVFVRDRQNAKTELVSIDAFGAQGNDDSSAPAITPDGRFVAFVSYASNLADGDMGGFGDVFVLDRWTGTIERVSVDSFEVQGNSHSGVGGPSISADGRYVAFVSWAGNLVPGDTNTDPDVFVRDRRAGTTERVSVSSFGAQGNHVSQLPSISADGRFVAFASGASNLVPGDTSGLDVFVRDRWSGTTERVSVDAFGGQGNDSSDWPSISADGRFVAFHSRATALVPGDSNWDVDTFVRDRRSGTTERVSVDSLGAQGNNMSYQPSISADGRFVAFESLASNFVDADTNGWDVYVHDRGSRTGTANRFLGPVGSAGSASTPVVLTPGSDHGGRPLLLSVSDPRGPGGEDLVPLVILTTRVELELRSMLGFFSAAPGSPVEIQIPVLADPSLLPQTLHAHGFLLDGRQGRPCLVPALVTRVE